jgi:hypothetical protein
MSRRIEGEKPIKSVSSDRVDGYLIGGKKLTNIKQLAKTAT